jgi:hypothetical protein
MKRSAASVPSAACRWPVALGALAFALHAGAAPPEPTAAGPARGDVYTCLADARKSDREIPDCSGLQTRTSRAGIVTYLYTLEQQRALDDCNAKKAEEALEWRKNERSETNLRTKYPDLATLRRARDDDLAPARAAVERSRAKLADLDKERKRLALEAEFYPKGVPPLLQRLVDQNDALIAAQDQVLKKAQEDVGRIAGNFDDLEKTMKKLWGASSAPMPNRDCSVEALFLRSQTRAPSKRR